MDDAPRWIIADWLEERDQLRFATFIRKQLEYSNLYKKSAEPSDLASHKYLLHQLLEECRKLWGAEPSSSTLRSMTLRTLPKDTTWFVAANQFLLGVSTVPKAYALAHRGFLSEFHMICDDFMRVAAVLFSKHPITDVKFKDKRPIDWDGFDYLRLRWGLADSDLPLESHQLPRELFELIPRSAGWEFSVIFDNEADALAALSDACVAYGRKLAGLPPLKTER